ncbi:MAG: hypothetical protein ACPGE9_15385, partial [Algiphilus sp.]
MGASATTTADEAVRLQAEVCRPFPASRRIYVPAGDGVRVPMREIACSPTRTEDGLTPNAPITVYDTSGPYTDPDAAVDLRAQLVASVQRVPLAIGDLRHHVRPVRR